MRARAIDEVFCKFFVTIYAPHVKYVLLRIEFEGVITSLLVFSWELASFKWTQIFATHDTSHALLKIVIKPVVKCERPFIISIVIRMLETPV
jgi:hypothetical protein